MLSTAELALTHNNEAKLFLESFFLLTSKLYGAQSQILNLHSLIHLADDPKNMNCTLTELTAFPFENALGKIKRLVRSGNRPLAQVSRRIHERFYSNCVKPTIPPEIVILNKKCQGRDGLQVIKKN